MMLKVWDESKLLDRRWVWSLSTEGRRRKRGKRLEGKRKGHVCETRAVWYFSCQPEEWKATRTHTCAHTCAHTHSHTNIQGYFLLLHPLTFMACPLCSLQHSHTCTHTQCTRTQRKHSLIPWWEWTEGHCSHMATGSVPLYAWARAACRWH